jgi:hypothetical protein
MSGDVSVLEGFLKSLLGVRDNFVGTGDALPGGTALPDAEQRAEDTAFLDDLADLVVFLTLGRRDLDLNTAMLEKTKKLFHEAAQQWYDAGNHSVGDGLRAWLKVPAGDTGNSGDLLVECSKVLMRTTCNEFAAALAEAWDLPPDLLDRFQGEDVDEAQQRAELKLAGVTVPVALLSQARAAVSLVKDLISPNTGQTGRIVHACIQLHYLVDHPGDPVLFDSWVGMKGVPTREFTSIADAVGVVADLVRKYLPAVGGIGFKQPDILNLNPLKREMYEIKPFAQDRRGLEQLFGRYLLPLNTGLFGAAQAVSLLNSVTANGGYSGVYSDPPFLPGMWKPAPYYLLPDGEVAMVTLACPGLILYQSANVKLPKNQKDAPSYDQLLEQVGFCVAAMVAVAILGALAAPAVPALLAAASGFEIAELVAGLYALGMLNPAR